MFDAPCKQLLNLPNKFAGRNDPQLLHPEKARARAARANVVRFMNLFSFTKSHQVRSKRCFDVQLYANTPSVQIKLQIFSTIRKLFLTPRRKAGVRVCRAKGLYRPLNHSNYTVEINRPTELPHPRPIFCRLAQGNPVQTRPLSTLRLHSHTTTCYMLTRLLIALCATLLLPAERIFAQSDLPVCEPTQQLGEVWELSTRHYPDRFRCLPPGSPPIRPYKHSTSQGWELDSIENAFVDDGRLTILYVHGNFMERNNARDRVLIINRYLQAKAKEPYRLMMLSWPSEREPHPLRDVYENAESAESQALVVAQILERLGNQSRVSILGFSFGARAVTGGLHFAAGGSVPGFSSPLLYPASNQLSNYRVALVAPAVDRNWIAQGGKHALALDRVDGLINLYNSRDPILRRFRFIDRLSSPVAAGFAGFLGAQGLETVGAPRATQPLNTSKRIEQYDCGGLIGTTHSERSYYGECPYFGKVVDHLLWNSAPIANDVNAISNHD